MMETDSRRRTSLLPVALLSVTVVLLFAVCNLSGPEHRTGAVLIRAGGSLSALHTFVPDGTQITAYRVYGYGPSGQVEQWDFQTLINELLIPELAIGTWQFVVDALNSDGAPIISGTRQVLVRSNATTGAEITLTPLIGEGELIVEFRWPAELLENPAFEAILSYYGDSGFGAPVQILDNQFVLDDSGEIFSYRYQGTHDAGYYELGAFISDESGHPDQDITFTVRLLAGLQTSAIIDVETGEGSVEIIIIEYPHDPLVVSLGIEGDHPIAGDDQITIAAEVSGGAGDYEYRWYLNGSRLQDEGGPAVTFGPGLDPGRYWVSAVVSDGTVIGSDWIAFDVVFEPGEVPDAFTSATMRAFTAETVPDEYLNLILKAGMNAPSGRNSRMWEFIVIRGRVILDAIQASSWGHLYPTGTADFAIVVAANLNKQIGGVEYWPMDAAFASQALRSQATLLGISSVPCAIYPPIDGSKVVYFRNLLNIPDHVVPVIIIPFGYPAQAASSQQWDPSIVHWEQYEQ